MSATITTTTTTTTYTSNEPLFGGTVRPRGGDGGPELHDISHSPYGSQANKESLSDAIDDMAVPSWVKAFAKNILGVGDEGNLPSESGAAKTINNFQKEHDIGLLSVEQMQKMAETGYCTGKDGKTFQVPEEVQLAAQKMMDNNGELFKKMESATDGKHDGKLGQGDYGNAIKDGTISKNGGEDGGGTNIRGLSPADFMNAIMNGNIASTRPSEYGAAKTINDFQKEQDIGLLSVENLKMMAETGYCKDKNGNTVQVPEEVQGAAQRMMENNGELFKKLESATDGKHDGKLGQGDFGEALQDGSIGKDSGKETVYTSFGGTGGPGSTGGTGGTQWGGQTDGLPSDASAAKTINDFQKDKDIGLLSVENLKMMAETGYAKDKNGNTVQVPEDVQLAAQKMMDNNGELFKKLESATDGKHDGKLGQGDYNEAIKDGTISKDTGTRSAPAPDNTPISTGGLPTGSDAAKTINEFQKDKDIGLLSVENLKMMAETGYAKDKNGNTVQVPEDVQAAAQKLMDNNGELFKKLEASTDGKHDGKLGQGDYGMAIKDGTISA